MDFIVFKNALIPKYRTLITCFSYYTIPKSIILQILLVNYADRYQRLESNVGFIIAVYCIQKVSYTTMASTFWVLCEEGDIIGSASWCTVSRHWLFYVIVFSKLHRVFSSGSLISLGTLTLESYWWMLQCFLSFLW